METKPITGSGERENRDNGEHGEMQRMCMARRISLAAVALAWACAAGGRALDTSSGPTAADPGLLEIVGFEERSQWSSTLLHLEADEIGTRSSLSALLRRAERVRFRRPEGTEWGLHLVDAEGKNPCPVAIYINGSRYGRAQRPGSEVTLDALISGAAIAGLELHEGTEGPVIPGLDCGALLIWSLEADPVYGFLGDVTALVEGSSADRVTSVVLEPGSIEGRREGRYTFFAVLPGEYDVHFLGEDGPLDVRQVRAYAFAETEVSLEVN
jgi:hypothetical protein